MQREAAVSELVSALLITAVLVAGAAILLSGLTSRYPPVVVPHTQFEIWNESDCVLIQATGGDPLLDGYYYIRVVHDLQSDTLRSDDPRISTTLGTNNLTTGNTLNFTPNIPLLNARVQVIYLDGTGNRERNMSEFVLFEKILR